MIRCLGPIGVFLLGLMLLLLMLPHATHAHNGAVASAVPVVATDLA